jgi:hypothetical protein
MTDQTKKQWNQPQLTVLGDVESLTLLKTKVIGSSDGFVFNGVPISG